MSNMKRLRKEHGMTQAELAERSGVSIRMIQYYEQGVNDINKAEAITVYRLAKALECRSEDLLELDEPLYGSERSFIILE